VPGFSTYFPTDAGKYRAGIFVTHGPSKKSFCRGLNNFAIEDQKPGIKKNNTADSF